jgi:hypothetical protein
MAAAAEFQDSMLEYRALVDKPYENISYFDQLATYIPIDTKILCHHVLGMKGNESKLK